MEDATTLINFVAENYFEKPVDKNGKHIKLGDVYYGEDGKAWQVYGFKPGCKYNVLGTHIYDLDNIEYNNHLRGEWLTKECSQINLITNDNHFVDIGDTVYILPKYLYVYLGYIDYGKEYIIESIIDIDKNLISFKGIDKSFNLKFFTTKEPDTQEKIYYDALLPYNEYFKCNVACDNSCPAKICDKLPFKYYNVPTCAHAQIRSLLKRQQDYDSLYNRYPQIAFKKE